MNWNDCLSPEGVAQLKCLEVVFANTLQVITGLAGLALFVMLIIGGIKYLTSGGDPKASEGAKNTMTYALIGIVLMGLAYLIFNILQNFTGVDFLKFDIPE